MTRLITVTDKMLKATGVAHDAESAAAGFKAFCQSWREQHPDEEEPDFVHVGQEIWDEPGAPIAPQVGPVDDFDPGASQAITLRGIQNAPDQASDARDIYTSRRPALPASLEELDAGRLRQPLLTDGQRLGIARLPEDGHNVTGWQIVLAARQLGAAAEILPSGDISIKSPFGSGVYTIPAACKAINARCFHPGAL